MGRREFDRIARWFRPLADTAAARNLADDGALIDGLDAGRQLVVTTDAMVEGVHFLRSMAPDRLAAKLLRVNLSDLAAMGADPLGYSLVLGLPREIGEDWLEAFTAGLAADQARYGVPLTGGDSVSTPGPIVLSVTALGTVPTGQAISRSGAAPGDAIMVTGTLGDARLALAWLLAAKDGSASAPPRPDEPAHLAFLQDRLDLPEPRLAVGRALRGVASAALDISDGLGGDLGHILEASGVGAVLDLQALPLSAAARAVLEAAPDWHGPVCSGGDDYELLFTVPPGRLEQVAALRWMTGVPVTRLGTIVARSDIPGPDPLVDPEGQSLSTRLGGWDHFAEEEASPSPALG